jgi:hypothetical protein
MSDDSHHLPGASTASLRRWFLLLALAAVLLYAAGVNPYWRFQRDSPLYMGLGRSLAENGSYSFNGQPQVHVLPGFPAMLALIYMALGQNLLAMNGLVSLFGLGCIGAGYLLYRELHLTPFQTVTCVILLAFSRTLYYASSQIMTDVPFTFFMVLGLYFGQRMLRAQAGGRWGWCAAAGAAVLAASAIRPLGPVLLIGLTAALWLQPGGRGRWLENLGLTALLSAGLAVAGALWAIRGSPLGAPLGTSAVSMYLTQPGAAGVLAHLIEGAPRLVGSLSDTVLGTDLGLPFSLLLALLIGVGAARAARGGERLMSVTGAVYLATICLNTPGRRLMLPVLPVLLYWLVLGAGAVAAFAARRWRWASSPRLMRLGPALLVLAVLPNLAHLSRTVYEARRPDFSSAAEDGRLSDYALLSLYLRHHAHSHDRVLAYEDNVIAYFARMRAVRVRACRHFLRRHGSGWISGKHLSYLVVDPRKCETAQDMRELVRSSPGTFRRVASFGKLDLYRVYSDQVASATPPAGGAPPSAKTHQAQAPTPTGPH